MKRCFLVADLHLFSRRSLASRHQEAIEQAVKEADTFILGGDIFDFRWSHWPSPEDTAKAAKAWLQDLIALNPACQFHYVVGNHDHHPAMQQVLDSMAVSSENFQWEPYHLRIGDAFFLHGDAADPGMTPEGLRSKRARFAKHGRPARWQDQVYQLAVACRLHVAVSRLWYPTTRVTRQLHDYLAQLPSEDTAGVKHVYFGHTHLALRDQPWKERFYHNGGAPMSGLRFEILPVTLT